MDGTTIGSGGVQIPSTFQKWEVQGVQRAAQGVHVRVFLPVMSKILFKSTLSTSTPPKKYLKYKYKYTISKVFKIQVQNTCCWGGATLKCINMYGNVVTITFWLIVNEND